jgi:threonine dehydrogenase-like Zn-dependent dehydrogenase
VAAWLSPTSCAFQLSAVSPPVRAGGMEYARQSEARRLEREQARKLLAKQLAAGGGGGPAAVGDIRDINASEIETGLKPHRAKKMPTDSEMEILGRLRALEKHKVKPRADDRVHQQQHQRGGGLGAADDGARQPPSQAERRQRTVDIEEDAILDAALAPPTSGSGSNQPVARLHGVRDVQLVSGVVHAPKAGEVLLRVGAVALCGGDVRSFAMGVGGGGQVLGHDIAGVVAALGDGVAVRWPELSLGTRVAVEPTRGCLRCVHCAMGEGAGRCLASCSAGCDGCEGGCQHWLTYPAERSLLYALPEELSLADGAMLGPLSTALHAVDTARVRIGDTVAIIASEAGPLPLLLLQLARLSGAIQVLLVTPFPLSPQQASLARQYGVDEALTEVAAAHGRTAGGGGCDVAFDVPGGSSDFHAQAAAICKRGGTLVMLRTYQVLCLFCFACPQAHALQGTT